MQRFRILGLIVSLTLASPALADVTFSDRVEIRGSAALMSFGKTSQGSSDVTVIGDLGLKLDIGAGFGLSADVMGYRDGISAFVGSWAVTYTLGPVMLSAGRPQPAFDTHARTSFFDRFAILDEIALMFSASTLTLLDLDGGDAARGVRLDASIGPVDLAISQHRPEGMDEVVSAAARLDLGQDLSVSAGYERAPMGMIEIRKAKLALAKDFGRFDVSLAGYETETTTPFGASTNRAWEIGTNYDLSDRFRIGGSVLEMIDANKRVSSLDISYGIGKRTRLVAGASKTTGQDGLFWGAGLRADF